MVTQKISCNDDKMHNYAELERGCVASEIGDLAVCNDAKLSKSFFLNFVCADILGGGRLYSE
jgi:hypothetical protein